MVVPAYNEAARLEQSAARFAHAIAMGAIDPRRTELLVVDDGSSDGTAAIAQRVFGDLPHHRVVRLASNQGKGAAVRSGVAVACGAAIAFTDADMSIDPIQLDALQVALATHDVVIGSRTRPDDPAERPGLVRTAMGRAFSKAVNLATGVALSDTQCGFKGFRAPAARLLFHLSPVDGYAFDVDILAVARRLGLAIGEIPVHWRHIPGSRVRPLADAFTMARDVWRTSRRGRARHPVPALSVAAPPDGPDPLPAVLGTLGLRLPVVRPPGGTPANGRHEVLVLFPLSGPDDRVAVAGDLDQARPDLALRKLTLSFSDLAALSPLSLLEPASR